MAFDMREFRADLQTLCKYHGIGNYLFISDERAARLITNHVEAMRSVVRPPKKYDRDPEDPKLAYNQKKEK